MISRLFALSVDIFIIFWKNTNRKHAIITRGSYTFYPLFEDHLCIVTFGLIYDKFLKGKKVPGGEISGGGAQCVELKLRWQFCVHTSTWPEIYF